VQFFIRELTYAPDGSGRSINFEKGEDNVGPVVIYRGCTQQTIYLLYGRKGNLPKKFAPTPLNLPLHTDTGVGKQLRPSSFLMS